MTCFLINMSTSNFPETMPSKISVQNQNMPPSLPCFKRDMAHGRKSHRPYPGPSPQFSKVDMNTRIVARRHGVDSNMSLGPGYPSGVNWRSPRGWGAGGRGVERGVSSIDVDIGSQFSRVKFRSKIVSDSRASFSVGRFEKNLCGEVRQGARGEARMVGGGQVAGSIHAFEERVGRSGICEVRKRSVDFRSPLLRKRVSVFNQPVEFKNFEYPTVKKRGTGVLGTAGGLPQSFMTKYGHGQVQMPRFGSSAGAGRIKNLSRSTQRGDSCVSMNASINRTILRNSDFKRKQRNPNIVYTSSVIAKEPQRHFFDPKICDPGTIQKILSVEKPLSQALRPEKYLADFQQEANIFLSHIQHQKSVVSLTEAKNAVVPNLKNVERISNPLKVCDVVSPGLKKVKSEASVGLKGEIEGLRLGNDFGEYFLKQLPSFINESGFQESHDEVLVLAIKKRQPELEEEDLAYVREQRPVRIEARKTKKTRFIDQFDRYIAVLAEESVSYRVRHPALKEIDFFSKNEVFVLQKSTYKSRVASLDLRHENLYDCLDLLRSLLLTTRRRFPRVALCLAASSPKSIVDLKNVSHFVGNPTAKNVAVNPSELWRSFDIQNRVLPVGSVSSEESIASIALQAMIHEILENKLLTPTSSVCFTGLHRLLLNGRVTQPFSLAFFVLVLSQFVDPPVFHLVFDLVCAVFEAVFPLVLGSCRLVYVEGQLLFKWESGVGRVSRLEFSESLEKCQILMLERLVLEKNAFGSEFVEVLENICFGKILEDFVFLFEEIRAS